MTAVSRTAQFAKLHRVLKKHYKVSPCNTGRSVIEHLLFACCLEDAHRDTAEEAFAALVHTFFDWNEVRVTSISELSEVMSCLPDPRAAANRVKRLLHAIFEATFAFDLEDRRKKNLGPTVTWLEKLDGATPFIVSFVVQVALGGHSVPIDRGTVAVLRVLDLVTDKDVTAGVVPGLERAVAKSKGVEFGVLVHELGADYAANPYSPSLRELLVQIEPSSASRLPKRRVERAPRKLPPSAELAETKAKEGKSSAAKSKPSPTTATEKPSAKKKASASSEPAKKKSAAEKPAATSKKRSASEGLAKRKPR
ncbi:MAG: hypothetical protein LLF97_12135 [Planctomycetaceae bacterium]|nr:hypothetical protein [Planctomycetaceae bacterium]